jgi:hypothetical protein
MALPVDYLSKIPQFAGKTKPIGTVLQLKAKYINHRQALNWVAEQTALIIGYENGCPDEGDLATEAVAFLRKHEDNSDINFEFVTTLGDKLDALRSTRPRYAECDDNIHSVWSPVLNLFERLGGEVFEIDASPSSKDEHRHATARENGDAGRTGTGERDSLKTQAKPTIENQREIELSEALRWTVSVIMAK